MASPSPDTEWELCRAVNQFRPIHSLPFDALSHILVLGQTLETESTEELHGQPFEIRISHVTSHFRATALDTPILWSIHEYTMFGMSSDGMEAYIARSKYSGLNVRIDTKNADEPSDMMKKVDVLVPHSNRFRRLVIDTKFQPRSPPIIQRFKGAYSPLLVHLSISLDKIAPLDNHEKTLFCGGAPILATLRLRDITLLSFLPPLVNVTTLHLEHSVHTIPHISDPMFVKIVTTPTFLQNLSVYGDIFDSDVDFANWDRRINLPHLRNLRIRSITGEIFSGLLIRLTSPRLESLVLKDLREDDLVHFSTISEYRFPLLRTLSLFGLEMSWFRCLETVITAFPHIVSFTTSEDSAPSMILNLLSRASLGADMWPALRSLTIQSENTAHEDLLVNVMKQRIAIGRPLGSLRTQTTLPLLALPDYVSGLKGNDKCTWERVRGRLVGWPEANSLEYDQDDTLF